MSYAAASVESRGRAGHNGRASLLKNAELMGWWKKIVTGAHDAVQDTALGRLLEPHSVGDEAGFELSERPTPQELAQTRFFTAIFSLLGYVTASDGAVCTEEREFVDEVIDGMTLDREQRRAALSLFSRGKKAGFDPAELLAPFIEQLGRRKNLVRSFLQILIEAAWRDGIIHKAESDALTGIASRLGVDELEYSALEFVVGAAQELGERATLPPRSALQSGPMPVKRRLDQRPPKLSARERRNALREANSELSLAYAVLGVERNATDGEVRRAYHRALSRHRADKLVRQGLPQEMETSAERMTSRIRVAYRIVRSARESQEHAVVPGG